jgi:hypothetical protein
VRHITNPDVMHEESDVSIKGVGTFVGMLAAGVILIAVLMVGLYKLFEKKAEYDERRERVSPMSRTEAERLPPPPRLQAAPGFRSLDPHDPKDERLNFELKHPQAEWEALREKWDFELKNGAVTDPNTGTGRIPIEDAKRLLLGQNLPVRQQQQGQGQQPPAPPLSGGDDMPSYSSAGRQPEKRNR